MAVVWSSKIVDDLRHFGVQKRFNGSVFNIHSHSRTRSGAGEFSFILEQGTITIHILCFSDDFSCATIVMEFDDLSPVCHLILPVSLSGKLLPFCHLLNPSKAFRTGHNPEFQG